MTAVPRTEWVPGQTAMPLPPTVATSVSGFCQFAMHIRCTGAAGDPCSCRCHAGDQLDASRDRTTPPRDFAGAVDQHGCVAVDVTVAGRRTFANLTPQTAAEFLREIADDLASTATPSTSPGALHV